MAENFFSDHFNNNATPGVTTLTGSLAFSRDRRPPAGLGHSRVRKKIARMTVGTGAVIGSELRMMQIRSSDRIGEIFVSSDGGATAFAADLGLYKVGSSDAHDGAVIDAELFASALALSTAIARVDQFKEATTLDDEDRWKTAWELAAVGAASYTEDPQEDWDIVLTVTTALTVALNEVVVEITYTSGD